MDPLATSMLEINRDSLIKKNQKDIEKQIKEQLDTEEEEIAQAIKEAIAENDVIELKEFNLNKDSSALQKAQSELSPRSLLSSAAEQGANDVIAYFLQTGLKPHPNEDLISDAILNEQYDAAESLILHAENFPCIKINPETVHDTPGQSHPLWNIANIRQENLQILQVATLLLEAGANPNFSITNFNGNSVSKSPLSLACQYGNMQLAELLLKHNADVSGHSSEFMPPIFIAARYLQPDTLELLVNEGADIDLNP
ncbi:ankyrin repeat domain-containing protein [Endozoicomonas sp. Mp262]|uniref:ankyrin repeat domain-containing protein n=1 Tax=Endozoicomonas sp. Mp262 TaxID=2919499 RepID=UPI0021D8CFF5